MTFDDELKLMITAYLGVLELDEYDLKVLILKEMEDNIKKFISSSNINLKEKYDEYENVDLVTKLQNSLIVLNSMNGPMDLIILIKRKLERMK